MIASSRTPEGNPLRCPICGASSSVEFSDPPGDSICPSCGTLVWMFAGLAKKNPTRSTQSSQDATAGSYDAQSIEATRKAIWSFVKELTKRSQSAQTRQQFVEFLVSGLKYTLAAQGAVLWVPRPKRWWRRHSLRIEFCAGRGDRPDFASQVIAGQRGMLCERTEHSDAVLLVGVPLVRNGKVLGALEVVGRANSSPAARRGYLRFLTQMADIASRSRVFYE